MNEFDLIKVLGDNSISLLILGLGIYYFIKREKRLEDRGLRLLEDMNAHFKEFANMQDLIKKIDTQNFEDKFKNIERIVSEIKALVDKK